MTATDRARARARERLLEARKRDAYAAIRLERVAGQRAELEADARAGRRVPAASRITCALDAGQHYGPQVDAALGVLAEPPDVVDRWEAGTLVPTWDEVLRLAELTGFLPEWFYGPELPEPVGVFICRVR